MGFFTGPFRAVASGFNILSGPGTALRNTPNLHIGSAVGAVGGAAYGAGTSDEPGTGAVVGAASGYAAGATAPVALGLGVGAAGYGAVGAARGIGGNVDNIGQGMRTLGRGIANTAKGAAFGTQVGRGGPLGNFASRALNPVGRWTDTGGKMLGGMVRHNPSRSMSMLKGGKIDTIGGLIRRPSPFSLTKAGGIALGGAAIIGGIQGAWENFEHSRMGEMDREVTRATPRLPMGEGQQRQGAPNHAGATGDLVFAMNANRRG